ncbi:MAG: GNAT family N-acetyltransferase, partial [Candidatus Eisenbacteria sp.]|nr:GNAT family N-acetyltransferase [Candidatus Eisenbacteria bacterium]
MNKPSCPEGLIIRLFDGSDRDYDASVAIWNAISPGEPASVEGARYANSVRDKKYLFRKLMAELDGEVVATAIYREPFWSYAPGKYAVVIRVLPRYQQKGIGGALYDYIMERLQEQKHKPVNLHSDAREDQPHSVRFLTKRGFEQKQRQQVSRLDVASFDAAPFAGSLERFEESGLVLKTLDQFRREDPDALRKVHDKFCEFFQDVPYFEEPTDVSLEHFEKDLDGPYKLDGGFLIAFDGDEIVGTTSLSKRLGEPGALNTGLTAVARSHRRRGIATALKVRSIEFAGSIDARVIQTDNEGNNPMYDLNVRLGFKPTPAWLIFQKLLNEEG